MSPRASFFLAVAVALGCGAACVGSDPDPTDSSCVGPGCPTTGGDGGPTSEASAGAVLLSVDATTLTVRQGDTAKLEVEVQRAGVTGPLHVDVTGAPNGVVVSGLTLAADATTGELTFDVAKTADVTKTPATLTVTARADSGATAMKSVALVIQGASGTLDTMFGDKGVVVQSVGNDAFSPEHASCIGFDGMGRLYVTGVSFSNGTIVERYADDGSLDKSFAGGAGYFAVAGVRGDACAILADGSVLVGGAAIGNLPSVGVARVTSAGALDSTFGTAGRTVVSFGGANDGVTGLVVLGDGTIVMVGYTMDSPGSPTYDKVVAVRVTSGGTAGTPVVVSPNSKAYDGANAAALSKSGSIVVGGSTKASGMISDASSGLLQLLSPSTLARDTGFSFGAGYAVDTLNWGSDGWYSDSALVVQPDGKIVGAGTGYYNGNNFFGGIKVARYDAMTGLPDTTFGNKGHVIMNEGIGQNEATAVALQKDGKIVVGADIEVTSAEKTDFAVLRFDAAGTLDPTFGTGGKAIAPAVAMQGDFVHAIAIGPDGRIVVAGETLSTTQRDWAIMRFWP